MSAPEPLKLTLEEARQAYEKAAAELDRICQGPRHGFRMQIPAHPDDSDLVLGEALGALKQLIAERDEAAELRAALADLAGSYVTNKVPHDNLWNMLVRTEVLARARAALAASERQP